MRDPDEKPNTGNPSEEDAGVLVASFEVRFFRCINAEGASAGPLPALARDFQHLRRLYRTMLLVRTFDNRAIALQRTGQLGTYASCLGQEAVGAAIGDAMHAEDVLLPSYRETPALLMRGVTMTELLMYWGGDERGMNYGRNREDFPICVPIATQAPHAVGVASAFKLRRQPRVAVCVLGDGGTSKGDFYEALNLAGAWRLPVVFVVVNNQWAISVPRASQSGSSTLAQKAIAAGIGCEQVDGNDLIAIHERFALALEKTRNDGGPYLLEAVTYRLGDHTTADDSSRYRDSAELERYRTLEPLIRLRRYLEATGEWDRDREDAAARECGDEVEAAVKAYLDTPPPAPESMFDHLYHSLPEALHWQRQEVQNNGRGCG